MPRQESSPRSDSATLTRWLRGRGFSIARLEPLAGDVSPRRYQRAELDGDGGSVVVALYPEALAETCRRFRATTELLAGAGIRVPEILAMDCEAGVMVVADLGPDTVYELASASPRLFEGAFRQAAELAERIAQLEEKTVAALNPPLDEELLRQELRKTHRTFFSARRLFAGEEALERRFESALDELCSRLGAARPRPCHRDFMMRNLVLGGDGVLGVLDHQDLRLGPPLYDLASLLNNSLFPSPALEEELVERYASRDRSAYHRVAAHRTLKAIGTYASFAEHGSRRHLPLIPETLERALKHLSRVPEAAALSVDLKRVLGRGEGTP